MVLQDLDRNSLHARMKITVPQEPDFATSHRANRIRLGSIHWMIVNCYGERSHTSLAVLLNDCFRHKGNDKLDQDSTSVYRFKARPLNRKVSIC